MSAASFVCALILGAAAPAFAQRANGPYSGLFGGQDTTNQAQGLNLNLGVFGEYDKNEFPADQTDLIDPRLREDGASVGVMGSLQYQRNGDFGRFTWSGGGTSQDYSASPGLVSASNTAATLSWNMRPKLVFDARASAGYSPFFQFSPFQSGGTMATGPSLSGFGFAAVAERNVMTEASAGLTSNVTQRTSLFANANRSDTHLLDSPDNNLDSWGGSVGIRHHVTRALGLHLIYGQQEITASEATPRYQYSTIDAGVDYGDSLTFARRTTLAFSTSTAMVRFENQTNYRLNGNVTLARGFGRSWTAFTGYNRDTQFMVGFVQPLLTDSVRAGVSGLLSLRTKWSASGGYTRGSIGFGGSDFNVYSAATRFDVGLTKSMGLYAQYAYYRYQVPAGSSDIDILSRLSRQTATVGLTVWVPLIDDVRKPKDSK